MKLRNRGAAAGFLKLLAPVMVVAMRRANRNDLSRLRALLARVDTPLQHNDHQVACGPNFTPKRAIWLARRSGGSCKTRSDGPSQSLGRALFCNPAFWCRGPSLGGLFVSS